MQDSYNNKSMAKSNKVKTKKPTIPDHKLQTFCFTGEKTIAVRALNRKEAEKKYQKLLADNSK